VKFQQGDVVIGPDFIGGKGRRPFLIISNSKHPFDNEEFLVAAITTTEREEAIELKNGFNSGGLPKESYISPWVITTLKESNLEQKMGEVKQEILDDTLNQLEQYIEIT
jgi:mRNA-degrading endonuclease toxin of MazEF toxin-antitoxin module